MSSHSSVCLTSSNFETSSTIKAWPLPIPPRTTAPEFRPQTHVSHLKPPQRQISLHHKRWAYYHHMTSANDAPKRSNRKHLKHHRQAMAALPRHLHRYPVPLHLTVPTGKLLIMQVRSDATAGTNGQSIVFQRPMDRLRKRNGKVLERESCLSG